MYFKKIENGYLTMFGEGKGGTEISEAEYVSLKNVMATRPTAEPGYDYRLKEDLTWELYELPPEEAGEELTAEEALSIITGGAV